MRRPVLLEPGLAATAMLLVGPGRPSHTNTDTAAPALREPDPVGAASRRDPLCQLRSGQCRRRPAYFLSAGQGVPWSMTVTGPIPL